MALVEKYHVVAAVKPVASGQIIKEGQIVSLNSLGEVVLQGWPDPGSSRAYQIPYGIAGDTKSTTSSEMPGVAAGWQNRVSDYFDETAASGKMTVYHSGGEFATDQFASNVAALVPMAPLFCRNGVLDNIDYSGSSTVPSIYQVGWLTQVDGPYPSGVPGTDINGDIALGGENQNTYIEFKLII